MNVCEHEGKTLLAKHGIAIPAGILISGIEEIEAATKSLGGCWVVKAQILEGNRAAHGGVVFCESVSDVEKTVSAWLARGVNGQPVERMLLEEHIVAARELYVSCLYDAASRGPLLLVGRHGGSGVETREDIRSFPIDSRDPARSLEGIFGELGLIAKALPELCEKLVKAFFEEDARQIEINPVAERADGSLVALDAKVALDDAVHDRSAFGASYRALSGDIATLFSGGGASLVNMDAMQRAGLRAANYAEYSGNPPKEKVRELATLVLSKPGLRGALIVGGIANFTDVKETFEGIAEALDALKPSYPIVVRRAGPREREGLALLRACAERNGLRIELFGKETSMDDAVTRMKTLAL
ncbi:MAG: ATP citrate lyase citrate-binding domain-containing protein [Patescibacteria group bacterium]|nr:MAG: ATP citrate lyase citrate-binding domain-containing protein [Patescibacteria group bacterium]